MVSDSASYRQKTNIILKYLYMKSCKENCPILLAIKARVYELEDNKQSILNASVDYVDSQTETTGIGEQMDFFSQQSTDAPTVVARRESVMQSLDIKISELHEEIDLAAKRCAEGVQYDNLVEIGGTVLRCGGVSSANAKILLSH